MTPCERAMLLERLDSLAQKMAMRSSSPIHPLVEDMLNLIEIVKEALPNPDQEDPWPDPCHE